MKTSDLIDLLAKDIRPTIPFNHMLAHAAASGTIIAAIAFLGLVGFRADIAVALGTGRFLFKFVITLALAFSSALVLLKIGKPGVPLRASVAGLALPLILALCAAIFELAVMPADTWVVRAIGHNAVNCLTVIPSLSLGPLACFLYALRHGAPEHPGAAGLVAGLTAAGIAATFYASNCDDDSPLFVLLWYPLAISAVASIGYVAGCRLLRW